MGRILNVKDMGLSTCYNITDSKHAMSLEVSSISVENPEFHVKRPLKQFKAIASI